MALQIWIPNSERPRWRCRLCKASFYEGQFGKYERHVVACGNRNEAELMAMSPKQRMPEFHAEPDPEFGDHWRRKLAQDPHAAD